MRITLQSLVSRVVAALNLDVVGRWIAYGFLIGTVAGLGAILFQVLCQLASHAFLGLLSGYYPSGPAGEVKLLDEGPADLRLWLLVLAPAVGGLLSGILVFMFAPEAEGHGTDAAIDAFHNKGGLIRARVPFVKTIASALTIGSGGSGGREGPIAQIGAGFGSFLATRLRLSKRDRRIMLAAGMGAGVGSIFRAPLAGALFAAEILYSEPEFESDVVVPAAVSTIIAYCVFSIPFGFGSLFQTPPDMRFGSPLEFIPYTVLALVVAMGAALFVTIFYSTHDTFHALKLPNWIKPMIGGALTGLVGVGLYSLFRDQRVLDVMSFGYGTMQQALFGHVEIWMLLALAFGKMVTTSLSIGSGGSGGVFGPSMVIGGSLGGTIGILAKTLMPHTVTQPGAYAVVGMAGFFAAAGNVPISTIVMVSEMTGSYHLLLPALWVSVLAYLIARRWNLYRSQVPTRFDSPAHKGNFFVDVLEGMRVRDLVELKPPVTVPFDTSLQDLVQVFTQSVQAYFPVVDSSGRMVGILSANDLRPLVNDQHLGPLVIAGDIATGSVVSLRLDDDLNTALQRFVSLDVEELPVVDGEDARRVVSMLSRRHLIAAYNRQRLAQMAKASQTRS